MDPPYLFLTNEGASGRGRYYPHTPQLLTMDGGACPYFFGSGSGSLMIGGGQPLEKRKVT